VRELLLAGRRRVREVLLAAEMDPAEIIDDIVELARDTKVPVREISRRSFDSEARTQAAQGVLARCAPLKEFDLEDLAGRAGAFLVVLDGVTDPQNLGALMRTAECAGVTGIVLPRHRAVHVTPTVTKAAAGAIEHLPMALVGGVPAALAKLQRQEVVTIGLDASGPTSVFELPLDPDMRVALVLGAEGQGLSRLVRQRVDLLASIPMRGQLNSLNVAMAGAVACFEVVRQRTAGGPPPP
jgi:23S rRNA (guanosine2251-2'-O)-methyltransferase